jgi:hypothetical protein
LVQSALCLLALEWQAVAVAGIKVEAIKVEVVVHQMVVEATINSSNASIKRRHQFKF